MKNCSPRFKYEFDTVDTVAMRNVSEKRKLKEHLGELEKELHNNLVRMETEMLSMRLEKSEVETQKGNTKPNDIYNKGGKSLSVGGRKKKAAGQCKETQRKRCEVTDGAKTDQLSRNPSGSFKSLPKITTTPSLTTKQVLFDYEKESLCRRATPMQRAKSMETISELGQKESQAERRILTSLHCPRSGVKLASGNRPPTPQARSPTRLSLPNWNQRRRSWGSRNESHRLLVPLPDEYSPKTSLNRARSVPNVAELADLADFNALRAHNKGNLNGGKECKKGANGVELGVTSQNMTQRVPGFHVTDFDKRGIGLELLEDGVPDQNDMKKIRYLRHKDEAQSKETENILSVFD